MCIVFLEQCKLKWSACKQNVLNLLEKGLDNQDIIFHYAESKEKQYSTKVNHVLRVTALDETQICKKQWPLHKMLMNLQSTARSPFSWHGIQQLPGKSAQVAPTAIKFVGF